MIAFFLIQEVRSRFFNRESAIAFLHQALGGSSGCEACDPKWLKLAKSLAA